MKLKRHREGTTTARWVLQPSGKTGRLPLPTKTAFKGTSPRHGFPEIGDLAPNSTELAGHQDKVRIVSINEVVQFLWTETK